MHNCPVLHELRKRIKDHYYQLRYFTLTQSTAKQKQQRQLQRVGHQLGLVRDITLLAQSLDTVTSTPASEEFYAEIETMAGRFQRNALKNI